MDTLLIAAPPILDLRGRAWFDVRLMHLTSGAFR
jgi:hypothetical protein